MSGERDDAALARRVVGAGGRLEGSRFELREPRSDTCHGAPRPGPRLSP
jgi:hypothetical protein